ncbi:unnamed protein product [Amoebophrya sp. A25]|nr:unnamed protein product [Amoebophrya sp. A25]|eukprot:GSA25T00020070001.1
MQPGAQPTLLGRIYCPIGSRKLNLKRTSTTLSTTSTWSRAAHQHRRGSNMVVANTFNDIPERPSFPDEEQRVLQRWRDIKAFDQCMEQAKDKPAYIFYDGPPFATGLPHYGHILAGTIKDVVCRYQHQNGKKVLRKWGWDCHGLPVEQEIDKKLGIKERKDVFEMGIPKYNEECRSIVQRYASDWKATVERYGRWVDMENDYRTMDINFMESVWWVFKQLFNKGSVYRAYRVMPYSFACQTALSNFEVGQAYKDRLDPSVIIRFRRTDQQNASILAWTTTPWTLPSNMALCVHPTHTYLKVLLPAAAGETEREEVLVGRERLDWVLSEMKIKKEDCTILKELPGKELGGLRYEPLFPYAVPKVNKEKAFQVFVDEYVGTEAGTMIVHQAPQHGEDDYRVCVANGLISKGGDGMPMFVDEDGKFVDAVTDFAGMNAKMEADPLIKKMLKEKGNLVASGQINHSYPHCWRSDTPLIYKAIPSWFVKVEEIREKLIANNHKTRWVPSFVQEKRFHNWLAEARDWCVSRTRFWGTPIPLWCSSDFEEIVCIGSVAELEQYAGRKITDIHRHFIDDIEIPSKMGKGMLRRVDEVFDCWFESGSMPYAQMHYPFENKELLESGGFPAQFIAEGLDQTRGWFYTLMVLSTHLFDQPPFLNLICNGLILAEDGKKMSKRLKNYPDPLYMTKQYGADAVRMYMCNSPAVRAEPLRFKEADVQDVVKNIFLPWYNAYRFLVMESQRLESKQKSPFKPDFSLLEKSENLTDRWILAACSNLLKTVETEMDSYKLYAVVPQLAGFWEQLTNWYIRLNRPRMRGDAGAADAMASLTVLYTVLLDVTILFAPVTPFLSDLVYENLQRALPDGHEKKADCVHFVMRPRFNKNLLNEQIEASVKTMQQLIETARLLRNRKKIGLKTPLLSMRVVYDDERANEFADVEQLITYIKEEVNVMDVSVLPASQAREVRVSNIANLRTKKKSTAQKCKKAELAMDKVQEVLNGWTATEIDAYEANEQRVEILGVTFDKNDLEIAREVNIEGMNGRNVDLAHAYDPSNNLVILDFTPDEDLMKLAAGRSVANTIQKLCKEANLRPQDLVDIYGIAHNDKLKKALTDKSEYVDKLLRRKLTLLDAPPADRQVVATDTAELDDGKTKFTAFICPRRPSLLPAFDSVCKSPSEKTAVLAAIQTWSSSEYLKKLQESLAATKKASVTVHVCSAEDKSKVAAFVLEDGVHVTCGSDVALGGA